MAGRVKGSKNYHATPLTSADFSSVTRWVDFPTLCLELHLEPGPVKKLIRRGAIVGICVTGQISRLETDWRFVDPGEKYKAALSLQERLLAGKFEFDLASFPIISAREVAKICGFSEVRVRQMVMRGNLKPTKIGKNNFFTVGQVRDFLLKRDGLVAQPKPQMEPLLRWVMKYVEAERGKAISLEKMKADDELEGKLRKLLKLKEPERSMQISTLWRRLALAKDVAEIVASACKTERASS